MQSNISDLIMERTEFHVYIKYIKAHASLARTFYQTVFSDLQSGLGNTQE